MNNASHEQHVLIRHSKGMLTLCVGMLALSACQGAPGQGTSEESSMRVTLDWVADASYAGLYVGEDAGFYEDEGTDLEIIPGGPNAPVGEQNIAGDNADIAFTSNIFRLFSAIQEGQDLVLIGAQFQESPAGLLSLEDHPVRDAEEIEGAKILAGENSRPIIDATMDLVGVEDYEFVPSGGDINPLLEGEGEALWTFENTAPITLEHQFDMVDGTDFHFVTAADLGTPSYANILIADREYAEENREDVVAFLKGTIRGWEEHMADPERGAELTVNDYGASLGLELDVVTDQLSVLDSYVTSPETDEHNLLWIDSEKISGPVYESLDSFGLTDLPDADDVVDTSFLEDAYDELEGEQE